MAPTARVYIEMLGHLRVCYAELPPVTLPAQQPGALLGLLALQLPRTCSREELAEHLWPNEAPDAARHRLRNSLYTLRRLFESLAVDPDQYLLTSRSAIGLNPEWVETDVAQFERAARTAPSEAIALYRDDLLPEFYLDEFVTARDRLSQIYEAALYTEAQALEQSGHREQAVEIAQRLVARNPLHEETHLTLMRLYAAQGQPSAVLRQFQEWEEVLKETLGDSPSEETRQLMDTLRRTAQAQSLAPRSVPPPPASPLSLAPHSLPTTSPRRSPRHLPYMAAAVGALVLISAWRAARPGAVAPTPGAAHPLWTARYQPTPDETASSEPTGMILDSTGNIYVTGFIQTRHNDIDYLTVKFAPNGKRLWRARYNGVGNDVDRARAIALDRNGDVYVVGDSDNGKGNGQSKSSGLDLVTIKYDGRTGKPLWTRRDNGPADGEERAVKVVVSPVDGSVTVCGTSRVRERNHAGQPRCEWVVVRYESDGKRTWTKRESAAGIAGDVTVGDMAVDSQGSVFVVGSVETAGHVVWSQEALVVKYRSNGEVEWRRTHSDTGHSRDEARRVRMDAAGNAVVAGETFTGDTVNGGTQEDVLVLKFASDGNRLWKNVRDIAQHKDRVNDLWVTPGGDVALCGEMTGTDYFMVRYDASGAPNWVRTYNGRGGFDDNATAVGVDSRGNLLVTGWAWNGEKQEKNGTSWDIVTLKYDIGGRLLWKANYDYAGWDDRGLALSIDPQDNVIVAGQSDNGDNTASLTLVKYAP